MHHIGTDIIEIARIREAVNRWGESFLYRVFTEYEVRQYSKSISSLAARFAGKEAVIKALGTANKGISCLHGKAHHHASSLGLKELSISLSHSKENAIAFVVAERK
jgi:holo-[acyl-carrier protein] synthase